MEIFAIYVRVSETRDRAGTDAYMSPELQEAEGRAWCERAGVAAYYVESECKDEDVSGATAASERRLGRLIERCEAGEFAGVVVRDEQRFARDQIEGAVALNRLVECGARLVATYSGFDSAYITPEKRMVFGIMMEIGAAQRARNRLARLNGSQRAFDQGYYLASKPPLGYKFVDRRVRSDGSPGAGKLEIVPEVARLVREAFLMAPSASHNKIRLYLAGEGIKISKEGVRAVLSNQAYLGKASRPTERKGVVEWVPNHHDPIVTEDEFQAAQAARHEYTPRDGSIVQQARLARLVYCAGCGKRMQVQRGSGKAGASYACRTDDCTRRATIRCDILDPWVYAHIELEYQVGNPHIAATLTGEDRYAKAMAAVNAAQAELDAYRAEVRVSDVGAEAWKQDVAHRTAALQLAREALRETPQPRGPVSGEHLSGHPFWGELKDIAPTLIDRIEVSPVGRGRKVPPAARCVVQFAGA
jgi:DNA invertase Pin-like site-specific DNA recombinase